MIVRIKLEYNTNEDEVLEWLDDLTEGKSERSFIGWAKRVEELANQRCNELLLLLSLLLIPFFSLCSLQINYTE